MDYLATGSVITNRLLFADGKVIDGIIGGSAIFALEGIKLWSDSCALIANVGDDFDSYYGGWFRDNNLTYEGIRVKVERTNYHYVKYFEDGRYFEESIYGPAYGWRNLGFCMTAPSDIERVGKGAKGLYMLMDIDRVMWRQLLEVKRRCSFGIMWEIRTTDCKPENLERILELVKEVEICSINLPEAKSLFSVDTEEEAVKRLSQIGTPVYFRVGKKGAYMIEKGKSYFVPTITAPSELDPTGCGNCSTGAAMVAYLEGNDPIMTGIMASIAASYNVQQYGPYPLIDASVQAQAMEMAKRLRSEYKE